MEARGSMPHSQGLYNNSYSEPNQPIPCIDTYSFKIHSNILGFQRKIPTWTRIQDSQLQISSLALYHLSHPDSIDVTGTKPSPGSNFSLEI